MKIGIIGSGNVGGALGRGWAARGHAIIYGARNPADSKLTSLVKEIGRSARAATPPEAAASGEVVVLATPWSATEAAIRSAGNLSGKIVLDCTNPLKPDLSGLTHGFTTSGAELLAGWAKGARVVKIFNTTGAGNMANPNYAGQLVTMCYCGDDSTAKQTAAKLASDLGFDPVDAGPLANARLLEPLALLWIWLAYPGGHGTNIAFKLLRR